MEKTEGKKSMQFKKWGIGIGLIVLLILATIPAVFYYQKYQKAQALLKNPSKVSQSEVDGLVKSVSKLISLPAGESPTVATVSDINKLKSQPFFKNAKNGDKVLIYTKAQKAIIYRPSDNKIIDVAPINLNQNPDVATGSAEKKQPALVSIALYNGTKTTGLTKKYEEKITADLKEFVVSKRDNAKKSDYQKSQLIAFKKIDTKELQKLADITHASIVDKLPDGETKPDTDILVILGSE